LDAIDAYFNTIQIYILTLDSDMQILLTVERLNVLVFRNVCDAQNSFCRPCVDSDNKKNVAGVDYVILAPREPAPLQKDTDPQDRPAIVKKLLLDHVILGQKLNLATRQDKKSFSATTLGGRDVEFTYKEGNLIANQLLYLLASSTYII